VCAAQMVTPFLMPMLIFSGYMRPLPSVPHYLRCVAHTVKPLCMHTALKTPVTTAGLTASKEASCVRVCVCTPFRRAYV
jgi:hypothetical protein